MPFSTSKIFGATIRESANDGSDFTNPDADYRRLFLGEDGQLHVKDSAGSVTDIGAGTGAPTDATYLTTSANGTLSAEVVVTAPATGGNVAKVVRKASNETVNNSATLQDDDALLLALAASDVYAFRFIVFFTSGTTPDFKAALTVPSGATLAWGTLAQTDASGTIYGAGMESTSGASRSFASGSGTRILEIVGYVANGANAGNLQLQWAQNTQNASDTIVLANSLLMAWKLA